MSSEYIDVRYPLINWPRLGAILGWHGLRSWEWDPAFPCRSIVPPFLTTGLPLAATKVLFPGSYPIAWRIEIPSHSAIEHVSGHDVFLIERLSSLVLSFVLGKGKLFIPISISWLTHMLLLDICVAQVVRISRAKALLLLASSHVLMTFQLRPFSNSLEAVLVAASLATMDKLATINSRVHQAPEKRVSGLAPNSDPAHNLC